MDMKNLIACLVFLLIWSITISQQVSETKDPRVKIYHKNHIEDMKKQSSLTNHQIGKIKKYIELKSPDLGPVNFINKNVNPENRKQSKVFRIKPTVHNQRKPFMVPAKNWDDLNFKNNGLNKTNMNKSELKEEDVTNDSKDASAVSTDESTPMTGTDPQLGNKLINEFNKIIPTNITSPNKPAIFIDIPISQNLFNTKSQIMKPLVTELKLQSKEKLNPEIKQIDIKTDTTNITEEAINDKTEDSGQTKLNPNDNDKEKKKHPFLEAIQNDRYRMCSPLDAPNASVIADTTSIGDIEIRFRDDRLSASPKATLDKGLDKKIPHMDNKDEVEGVTIKSSTYEEISDISDISDIPRVTVDPEFKANNILEPYEYNQILKTIDIHNQLDPRTPDEQRIEKTDKKNVFSYNYYQRPSGYWYGYNYQIPYKPNHQNGYCSYYQPSAYTVNYGKHASRAIPGIQNYCNKVYGTNRDVDGIRNAYYGYNSVQPQNSWRRDYDTTKDINERIHRKWLNTELSIKGKNAFKQFSDDNLRNRFVQSGPMQNAGVLF